MIIRAIISVCSNFFVYFTKKTFFLILFYTSSFTKHRYQFIYSTHLFNKIFILLQFFYYSLPHYPSLSQTHSPSLPTITPHPTNIITTQPPSSRKTNPLNSKSIHHLPNPKPSQAKSSPTQSATRSSKPTNELEKTSQSRSKPTDPHPQSTKKPKKIQ